MDCGLQAAPNRRGQTRKIAGTRVADALALASNFSKDSNVFLSASASLRLSRFRSIGFVSLAEFEEVLLGIGIRDAPISDPRKWCQRVMLCSSRTQNMLDWNLSCGEGVRNQRPVATPRHGLRTHQNRPSRLRKADGQFKRVLEIRSPHVIREPAKSTVSPPEVCRIRARSPEPSQCLEMHVCYALFHQSFRQAVRVELRIVPGARNRPYIDQLLDLVRP